MTSSTPMRATIAADLGGRCTHAVYLWRHGIENIFGPDSWWLVTGWIGVVIGLVHFLIIFIFARQPHSGGSSKKSSPARSLPAGTGYGYIEDRRKPFSIYRFYLRVSVYSVVQPFKFRAK